MCMGNVTKQLEGILDSCADIILNEYHLKVKHIQGILHFNPGLSRLIGHANESHAGVFN